MEETKSSRSKWVILGILIVVILGFGASSQFYIDWLWFKGLNLASVFVTTVVSKWIMAAGTFVVVFLILYLNLLLTRKYSHYEAETTTEDGREILYSEPPAWERLLKSKAANWIFVFFSLFVAWVTTMLISGRWMVVQQFLHRQAFGLKDPIFHRDIAFYVFNLNFYQLIYNTLMPILIITALAVGFVYLISAAFNFTAVDWKEFNWPKGHVAILLALIFALKAWGYSLASYGILNSDLGVVHGAAYTDVNARLLGFKILMVLTVLIAAMILVNIFVKRLNLIFGAVAVWVIAALLFGGIYPALVQKLVVEPNEQNKEKPYILDNIKYTRAAYGLNRIEGSQFKLKNDLSGQDIRANADTIRNIRLWDWQPLQDTYKSIQEIRPYYTFKDIDVDRYTVNGQYRQMMIAAREMDQTGLPPKAQTWVNKHLKYTHGYGVAMSPVNEIAGEGLPVLTVKNIPPQTTTDLVIKRPEIYYGEVASDFVLVNTTDPEFDYPGTKNATTRYKAISGIQMNSWARRLMLAWIYQDYKILISPEITGNSQMLIYRNIEERVNRIAPFLRYDNDPYVVLANNGKLYYIMDAYTTSMMFPYSEPEQYGQFNYVRNSVKVVMDAYSGAMKFYIADNQDPLIKAYDKVFPALFQPISKMPSDLRSHVRYPQDLFTWQAQMYTMYHMQDPLVFYNNEDRWNLPEEIVGGQNAPMEPYYTIMKLPDSEKPEFVLMMPFTPNGKQNMIAWMCARSDGKRYGDVRVYDFSKQELIYGPMQVEARINQDSEISQTLTLWDQKGSSVYRGNLLVIPIKNSILYVEPIYLQAKQSQIPELRRIVLIYNDQIVMEPTLDAGLNRIFGAGSSSTETAKPDTAAEQTENLSVSQLAQKAKQAFDQAQAALAKGAWSDYGAAMDQIKGLVNQMVTLTGGAPAKPETAPTSNAKP